MENETKTKWNYCQKIKIEKILVELSGTNNEQVERIRFVTEDGDITYRPKKQVTEHGTLSGFDTISKKRQLFTCSEFLVENPMLKELSDNTKKKPQEVTLSYAEISRFDENEDEEIWYKYLTPAFFHSIYYEKYHKDDKTNIEKI